MVRNNDETKNKAFWFGGMKAMLRWGHSGDFNDFPFASFDCVYSFYVRCSLSSNFPFSHTFSWWAIFFFDCPLHMYRCLWDCACVEYLSVEQQQQQHDVSCFRSLPHALMDFFPLIFLFSFTVLLHFLYEFSISYLFHSVWPTRLVLILLQRFFHHVQTCIFQRRMFNGLYVCLKVSTHISVCVCCFAFNHWFKSVHTAHIHMCKVNQRRKIKQTFVSGMQVFKNRWLSD